MQSEEQLIPVRIKSTSGFSNDVLNIPLGDTNNYNISENNNYNSGSSFNSSKLNVNILRNQLPIFKISIPKQIPLGIYIIPLIITIREPLIATTTKPTFTAPKGGTVDPEFGLSKKYPTISHLTKPINLTVTVISSKTINNQFRDFWTIYRQFIGIFAGAFEEHPPN